MSDGVAESVARQLESLAQWLGQTRPFWQPRPFVGLPVSWEAEAPELATALRRLTVEAIDRHEAQPRELDGMPELWRHWAALLDEHEPPLLPGGGAPIDRRRPRGVSERKWQQILAFADRVVTSGDHLRGATRWLDWCSGKGHLGRTLARVTGMRLVCIERESALCRAGAALARDRGVDARFVEHDVLDPGPLYDLEGPDSVGVAAVALHACGRLHRQLLRRTNAGAASMLAVAPCCHHRHFEKAPAPMSELGRRVNPGIGLEQRKLVGLSEVVAKPRRAALRRREQAYRLAFDRLLREASGVDRYRPLGAVPTAWIDLPFHEFARRLAASRDLALPNEGWEPAEVEAWGWERLRVVRALGLVRGLFRRPIELWLNLDLTQYLIEQGWTVRLGSFTAESITPRNLLIIARR